MTSPSARSASPPSHSFLSPITATSPLSSPPSTLPSPSSVELSPPTSPSSYNPSDPSRSPSRTRSLSPRPSGPTTTTMSLPSPTPSSALPSPNVSGPSLSPRPSKIFASRPSPVVPSPSVPGSRPTSPPPSFQQQHEPVSPTRGGATTTTTGEHDFVTNAPVLSTSSSTVDLSHVFERDVEFGSTHRISAQEAIDVAIAPVLDEAVVALSSSSSDLVTSQSVASLVRDSVTEDGTHSGWSSPIGGSAGGALHGVGAGGGGGGGHFYATASRSPARSHARSFSPDSFSSSGGGMMGDGARGASPDSSTTFSVGTPPDIVSNSTPSGLPPFSQHLSEALQKEAIKLEPFTGGNQSLFAPVPFPSTTTTTKDGGAGNSVPSSPSFDQLATMGHGGVTNDRRRLSFISYADVINEERLAELTGAPTGGETSRNVSGGAVDLAGVLDKLELAEESR